MRMLLHFDLPIEPFNSYVRDGTVGERIQSVMEAIKPEAAYFTEQEGQRGGVMVVDVASPSDVPRMAEPFFLQFEADVRFRICMLPDDLAAADLDALGRQWD